MSEEPQDGAAPEAEVMDEGLPTSVEAPAETEDSEAESEEPQPTYVQDTWSGLEHYRCLLDGHEGWSYDTFAQHMAVYHQGVMIAAPSGYVPEDPASEAVGTAEAGSGQAPDATETDAEPSTEAPVPPEEGG